MLKNANDAKAASLHDMQTLYPILLTAVEINIVLLCGCAAGVSRFHGIAVWTQQHKIQS
jgi:hypothetical protein